MENVGIIRRIDDLGRIVIPKEIRKRIKIDEGEQVEILVDLDGSVKIKKYLPLGDKFEILENIARNISLNLGFKILITDKEKVIIDTSKTKEFIDEIISINTKDYIKNRENFIAKDGKGEIIMSSRKDVLAIGIFPIIIDGDSIGSICVLPHLSHKKIQLNDMNIIKFSIDIVGKSI